MIKLAQIAENYKQRQLDAAKEWVAGNVNLNKVESVDMATLHPIIDKPRHATRFDPNDYAPLLVDNFNMILDGNHRYFKAKGLGMEEINVIKLKDDIPMHLTTIVIKYIADVLHNKR